MKYLIIRKQLDIKETYKRQGWMNKGGRASRTWLLKLREERTIQRNWSVIYFWVALMVKNPPANLGDVRDAVRYSGGHRDAGSVLRWEDPYREGMATHFSIFSRTVLWTEGPGELQSVRSWSWSMTEVT